MESLESTPSSTAVSSPTSSSKMVLGYTPQADLQEMNLENRKGNDTSLTRRLAAGRATEAIKIPLSDKDTAVAGGTFTRVDRRLLEEREKVNAASKTGPDGSGLATDTPIPAPASHWLILLALPALIIARKKFRP